MAAPHVLVLPFPAQGHVIPLMELSHCLVEHGVKVTFVNTELNHGLVLGALDTRVTNLGGVDMVSVPDGLGGGDDRKNLGRLTESFSKVMPGELEKLVGRINAAAGPDRIGWMIADVNMAWAFTVAKRLGLRAAGFCPSAAAMFATRIRIPELIRDGVLDEGGWPRRRGTFRLAPAMPPMDAAEISWNRAGDPGGQPAIFQLILRNNAATHLAEAIVCNSVEELEPGAFALFPGVLPVGPLSAAAGDDGKPVGSFWPEDASCAAWLDAQPAGSVVYVAFGSFAAFGAAQLAELAEGLALASRPFLWVLRPDAARGDDGRLLDRLRRRAAECGGRAVSWCPQRRVLASPAVACFVTHCGWNSTMEAAANGVPLLCWPYFADQFLNQSYVCDVWRTGLKMPAAAEAGEAGGVVGREVVKEKVEELLGDAETKARALALRGVVRGAVADGGSSRRNLGRFVDLVRGSAR
ncbi:hypothetical protein ACP4OV_008215 [Aristida adscensionis]